MFKYLQHSLAATEHGKGERLSRPCGYLANGARAWRPPAHRTQEVLTSCDNPYLAEVGTAEGANRLE